VVIVGVAPMGDASGLLNAWLVPPPHPARSKTLVIPKITSILMNTARLFMTPLIPVTGAHF
jgi:hypothetical protein